MKSKFNVYEKIEEFLSQRSPLRESDLASIMHMAQVAVRQALLKMADQGIVRSGGEAEDPLWYLMALGGLGKPELKPVDPPKAEEPAVWIDEDPGFADQFDPADIFGKESDWPAPPPAEPDDDQPNIPVVKRESMMEMLRRMRIARYQVKESAPPSLPGLADEDRKTGELYAAFLARQAARTTPLKAKLDARRKKVQDSARSGGGQAPSMGKKTV